MQIGIENSSEAWYNCRNNAAEVAKGGFEMKYVCNVCGYVYDEEAGDPDNGIAPGTTWAEVPEDFTCPLCGVGKDEFSPEE